MCHLHLLENAEFLDIIGSGSFGIVRKMQRSLDGLVSPLSSVKTFIFIIRLQVFAKKKPKFECITEPGRKPIIAEMYVHLPHQSCILLFNRHAALSLKATAIIISFTTATAMLTATPVSYGKLWRRKTSPPSLKSPRDRDISTQKTRYGDISSKSFERYSSVLTLSVMSGRAVIVQWT